MCMAKAGTGGSNIGSKRMCALGKVDIRELLNIKLLDLHKVVDDMQP